MYNIPVFEPNKIQEEHIVSELTHILKIKKNNPDADTTHLENQIDQLVYKLYALTEEEIKIVEGV